jgi:hypothetical protein
MHSRSNVEIRFLFGFLIATGLALSTVPARAAEEDTQALARAAQNPIAAMVSLPLQSNTNFNIGPYERTGETFNVQPVVPITLNSDWNLILRVIVPFIYRPNAAFDNGGGSGLGDLNTTFFFSPSKGGTFVWGVGPTITAPTATRTKLGLEKVSLGTEKWSAGPAAVGLFITGPWVAGALVNQQWSFAGKESRENVSTLLIQPFVNYNMAGGWYLTSSPVITANWNPPPGAGKWNVPLGGGVGKIFKVGGQAMNGQIGAYYNVEKPTEFSPDWQLRAQLTFLFPR